MMAPMGQMRLPGISAEDRRQVRLRNLEGRAVSSLNPQTQLFSGWLEANGHLMREPAGAV
jgi:hypothetical protein